MRSVAAQSLQLRSRVTRPMLRRPSEIAVDKFEITGYRCGASRHESRLCENTCLIGAQGGTSTNPLHLLPVGIPLATHGT